MKLSFEIETQLQEQYRKIWYENIDCFQLNIICKVYHPLGKFEWYLVSQDPGDKSNLWGIIKGDKDVEIGSLPKNELEKLESSGLKCQIDPTFKPVRMQVLYNELLNNKSW